MKKTDDILMMVAKTKQVPIIDASKEMTGKGDFFDDHIHLADKGSNQLAILLSEYLFNLIKEMDSAEKP